MRLLSIAVLVVALAACADGGTIETTVPTTTAPSTTSTTLAPTTSLTPTAQYTVADCETPPVTFALMCDVYELLARYHVDAPIDPSALAAGAALGFEAFDAESIESPSETFVCAIPVEDFERLCEYAAERLAGDPQQIELAMEEAVASMISLSLDPFTYYLPPELSGALTEDGIVTAVGLLLTIRDPVGSVCTVVENNCRLEVVLSVPDGPAQEAGLEAGDIIETIDGESVEGTDLVEVVARLDGPEGSNVVIGRTTEGGSTDEVVIERRLPPTPVLEGEIPVEGVGYIRLPDFGADIPQFLHALLEEWQDEDLDHIVLDLRDNPGGFVDVATLVASEFLPDGLVLRSEAPEESLEYPVQEGGLATSAPPLTVVVNAGSASASEILAGVLQERGRAVVVGEPTFGKDTVQIGFPLRNDGELRVTVARWVTPDGVSVARDGVVPDVQVEIPSEASPAEVVDLVLGQT